MRDHARFFEDLELSKSTAALHTYERAYEEFFPGCMIKRIEGYTGPARVLQDGGADVAIRFPGGQVSYVDEKFSPGDPNGLAIEVVKNTNKGSPGWVEDPQHKPDYLLVTWLGGATLYDAERVKQLWRDRKQELMQTRRRFNSANTSGYNTTGIYIDPDVLVECGCVVSSSTWVYV
jgi:hypothetical protein